MTFGIQKPQSTSLKYPCVAKYNNTKFIPPKIKTASKSSKAGAFAVLR